MKKYHILKQVKKEFTTTEQDKIPLNDIEARKMKDEIKNFKLAYNMQSAVDSETGLICAIPSIQSEDKIKPYKIKRLYNNYHACKKLINKEISAYQTNKHTQPSQKNCDRLIRAM